MKNKQTRSDSIKFEIRSVDEDKGIFEGYASVFGVVDTYGTAVTDYSFACSSYVAFNAQRKRFCL